MPTRRDIFLLFGVERAYPRKDYRGVDGRPKMDEPNVSRTYRRNILALASTITVIGLAGGNPHDISVLGMKPIGERGEIVVCAATVLTQMYWYIMRFQHLKEEGTVRESNGGQSRIEDNHRIDLVKKSANLLTNRAVAIMTIISWGTIGFWLFSQ